MTRWLSAIALLAALGAVGGVVRTEDGGLHGDAVTLTLARPEEVAALRSPSGKTRLINFWATWCPPCREEFPNLVKLAETYRGRPFELVTVSVNAVDEEKSVRTFLEMRRAGTRNLLNAFMTPAELMRAFDPAWTGAIPYSVVIGPDGSELYARVGTLDLREARRVLIESFSK